MEKDNASDPEKAGQASFPTLQNYLPNALTLEKLPEKMTESEVKSFIISFGAPKKIIFSRDSDQIFSATVLFRSIEGQKRLIESLKRTKLDGSLVKFGLVRSKLVMRELLGSLKKSKIIFIHNIPYDLSNRRLSRILSYFGNIRKASCFDNFQKKPKFGYVTFWDEIVGYKMLAMERIELGVEAEGIRQTVFFDKYAKGTKTDPWFLYEIDRTRNTGKNSKKVHKGVSPVPLDINPRGEGSGLDEPKVLKWRVTVDQQDKVEFDAEEVNEGWEGEERASHHPPDSGDNAKSHKAPDSGKNEDNEFDQDVGNPPAVNNEERVMRGEADRENQIRQGPQNPTTNLFSLDNVDDSVAKLIRRLLSKHGNVRGIVEKKLSELETSIKALLIFELLKDYGLSVNNGRNLEMDFKHCLSFKGDFLLLNRVAENHHPFNLRFNKFEKNRGSRQ